MAAETTPKTLNRLRFFWDKGLHRHWWKGFRLKVLYGRGAGYIGGWTFYLAWNAGSRNHMRSKFGKMPRKLELGFTRNANRVPFMSH